MTEKTEEVTEEQRVQLKEHAEKWVKIALNTDPYTDEERERYIEATKTLYKVADLEPPRAVVFVDGPVAGSFIYAAVASVLEKGAKTTLQDVELLASHTECGPSVIKGFTDTLNALGVEIPQGKSDKARTKTLARNAGLSRDALDNGCESASDACLITAGRYIFNLPIDYTAWEPYETLSYAGPRYMAPEFCLICNRASLRKLDEEQRLHAAVGPAVAWEDKIKRYYWHGVPMPAEWYEKQPSAAEILKHNNVEVRRAGCERMGWDTILQQLDAKVIDSHPNPEMGTLLAVDLPDSPNTRFLRVMCATGRTFALLVPSEVETVQEAQNVLHDVDHYAPDITA